MVKETSSDGHASFTTFLKHLEEARKLQIDWMTYGIDSVDLYVDDVDGDWLENWGEGEDEEVQRQKIVAAITGFLESNDWVAIRIRKHFNNESKPLEEIANELEKCLSILEFHERLFAVKKVLADGITTTDSEALTSAKCNDFELLDLAEELLEKLAENFCWVYRSN
ncbi:MULTISPECIES: hypothetical protein [Nostocales]|uniref:Uncharacterized protein n=3 Tax=Nostocales TaxID=1161 RepID=A0A0C1QPR1_9CYAN|nr:hypothetical protein [Tolypothrix bouteillei]KAF3889038.1 hypothetical protein DA73_0400028840 [Tolypothrix bouteillei VB521301]